MYHEDWRRPLASINFITAHDGFTLRDLVSYNEKHNEANMKNSSDGESHNLPSVEYGDHWLKVVDTHEGILSEDGAGSFKPGGKVSVDGRSVLVFRCDRLNMCT